MDLVFYRVELEVEGEEGRRWEMPALAEGITFLEAQRSMLATCGQWEMV